MSGDCGHKTAPAPRPACRSNVASISKARTTASGWRRQSRSMSAVRATTRSPSTPVTARWLYSMAVATVNSGTNWPLHSGQDRPQPSAEPVLVTAAPMTSTPNMPAQVAAASQRSTTLRFVKSSPE